MRIADNCFIPHSLTAHRAPTCSYGIKSEEAAGLATMMDDGTKYKEQRSKN